MKTKMTLREWLPLIGMTISAFLVNTSEFMPIGLLTDISNEFHMTEAQAGVMITAYSWTVTLLSLPLMLLVCRIQPKKLLLGTLSVFAVCQVLSVISSGFTFLVLSRIGVACAHSIFWAIASPVAVRVVAKEHQSKALSAIITGTSIAMVIGMPLGRMIGLQIGWRMTFLCVAIVSFLVLGYLAFVFPKLEGTESFSVGQLPELFKNARLMSIYVITFLVATGYYTSYSYIEPFLQKVAGLPSNWVTMALMLFGVAGLGGSYLFSRYYDDHRYAFVQTVYDWCCGSSAALISSFCQYVYRDFGMCWMGTGDYGISGKLSGRVDWLCLCGCIICCYGNLLRNFQSGNWLRNLVWRNSVYKDFAERYRICRWSDCGSGDFDLHGKISSWR